MADSLGTARLDLVVDTTDFSASVDRAQQKLTGLGDAAQSAFNKSDDKAKRAAVSLARYIELMGKGAEETRLLQAAFRGIDPTVLRELEQRMGLATLRIQQGKRAAQELADTHAFQQQANEARQLVKASEYVRFWEDALEDAARAEQNAARKTNFISNLQAQAIAINKTRSELLEMKAAELGVTREAAPFIAQLRAQERALQGAERQLNKYGMTAKEVQFAMRGVPAQLTDITVSLAGGQNPLMVLLQQGGQLRDMFGGIRPAIAAFGSQLAAVASNPVTLLAVAIGSLVGLKALLENETNKLTVALIQSGNAAGQSAEGLREMAEAISAMGAGSTGQALDALTEIVKSGRIAVDVQQEVATAVVAMSNASGQAVSELVAEYVDIARDPVAALYTLGAAHGFVTEKLAETVIEYDRQGNRAGAANALARAYAADQIADAERVRESLGLVTGAWDDIIRASRTALSDAKTYFHDLDVGAANVAKNIRSYFSGLSFNSFFAKQNGYTPLVPTAPAASARGRTLTPEQLAADKELRSLREGNMSREKRQELEEKRIRTLGATLKWQEKQIAAEIALSRAAFAEGGPKPKKPRSTEGAERSMARADLRLDLEEIKSALAAEQAAIANNRRTTEAEYAAKLIGVEEYYRRTREATKADTAAQEKALTDQIAILRGRNASGKDGIDITRQITQLEGQLAKVRADGGTELAVLTIKEQDSFRQRERALQDFKDNITEVTEGTNRDTAAQLLRITTGARAADLELRLAQVYENTRKALKALNDEKARGGFVGDEAGYEKRRDEILQGQKDQIAAVRSGQDAITAAQGEWVNGLISGLQDWMDAASDSAGQVRNITLNAMDTIADGMANAALTGKLAWKDMLRSILTDITKFLAKQAVLQFGRMLWGMYAGGGEPSADAVTPMAKGGAFDAQGITPFAKGGMFTNKIATSPTLFKFAKGARMGVMGEAGPEAIMPLRRGPDGSLGVQATGGGGGGSVVVQINTTVNNDGSTTTETTQAAQDQAFNKFAERMAMISRQEIQISMQPQGDLWRAGVRMN
jgi:lambda family phage tail tape measure protein